MWPFEEKFKRFTELHERILGYGARFGRTDIWPKSNEFKGFRNISASFDTLGRLFCSSSVLQHRDTWYHVWRQCRWALWQCSLTRSVFSYRKKISCFSVLHTIVHQLRFVYAKTYSMYQLAIFMVFEQCSVIRKRGYEYISVLITNQGRALLKKMLPLRWSPNESASLMFRQCTN